MRLLDTNMLRQLMRTEMSNTLDKALDSVIEEKVKIYRKQLEAEKETTMKEFLDSLEINENYDPKFMKSSIVACARITDFDRGIN